MKKIIYLFILCLFLVGCSNNTANNPSSNEIDKGELDEQGGKEVEVEPANDEFVLKEVGETFNLKDWEVTLESFEFNESVSSGNMSSSVEEGNKFLVLNLKVTNKGIEADSLIKNGRATVIKAVYNEKYEYETSVTLIDGDLHHESIRPLSLTEGFVAIEMPDAVVEASESIKIFFEIEKDKVQINIR